MRVNLAVIGTGWVVRNCYLRHLSTSPLFRVRHVYDHRPDRAAETAGALNALRAPDLRACLGSDTQGILICTPPESHLELIEEALAAGKHVLCEKPVIRTAREALRLKRLPGARDRLMGVAACRMRRDTRLLLGWIADGRIGQPRQARFCWLRNRGVPSPGSWRTDPLQAPTGVLEDLGPHLLDLAASLRSPEWLPGPLQAIEGARLECRYESASWAAGWHGASRACSYEVPDLAQARLAFASGLTLGMRLAWAGEKTGDVCRLEVRGSQGQVSLHGLFGFSDGPAFPFSECRLRSDGSTAQQVRFENGPAEQHRAVGKMLNHFFHFIRGKRRPAAGLETIVQVAECLEAVRCAPDHPAFPARVESASDVLQKGGPPSA